jgi:hypothetical protein
MLPATPRTLGAAILWTLVLLGSRPALAQEDSWAYVTLVTGPLERVEASFEELGAPLPRFLRRETYETEGSFIGPGGLRGAGSLGMRSGAGDPDSTRPSVLMFLPVQRDVAPLQEFTARGARLLPDSSDTVRIKSTLIRRTRGFLLMGESKAGVSEAEPLALEERLAAPGLLGEIDVNLDRWRKTDPSSFYQLIVAGRSADADPSHAAALGQGLAARIYERLLNRVRLTLTYAGSALRLRADLDPLAPGELAPLPRCST